ncbi:MAG: glutaminyl-peptide cyclotransferase [Bacteroidales bacterium]|nr:glutaminyl-peptide cyclotransferase [Bacteroidales bacterium]MBN2763778.1 glutaminyl-peptide cyclotransferase [Bacteroidales bacterium]
MNEGSDFRAESYSRSTIRIVMKYHIYVLSVLVLIFAGCCNKKTHVKDEKASSEKALPIANLIDPAEGKVFRFGDSVQIKLRIDKDSLPCIDSAAVFTGSNDRQAFYTDYENMHWRSGKAGVGKNIVKVCLFIKGRKETHSVNLTLLSDIVPAVYNYRIIQQYPHDEDAFTQGLFYDNGMLYESTGLEGKSSLRIVTIKTGIPVRRIDLEKQFFAEGIALFRDQIYQITYKSQVGFIYDKETLSLIRRFDYPIKEGWGLTAGRNQLIMSDGSAQLYFIEPEYFTQINQIEVYDNKGMVPYLNELEYVNDKILANIWFKSIIVVIDPETGRVTGHIDLGKLIPEEFKENSDRVLNGIACNPDNGHIYVTGKNWPVLYELEIFPPL